MVALTALWLPIVLATVAVWLMSAIFWTASPHHKSDFSKLPDEDSVLNTLRAQSLRAGQYFFPFAMGSKEMADPVTKEKFARGPVGMVTIMAAPAMGKMMVQSAIFYLVVVVTAAYVASRALAPGTAYLQVFRITGTVAFVAHAGGNFPEAIWFGLSWKRAWKTMADSLVYAMLTGGFFGWLWP
jgi:predicted small integral membrane protein